VRSPGEIACVGESTADRVRAFGSAPSWCRRGTVFARPAGRLPPYDSIFDPVNRVCCRAPDIATETLAEGLRERGWEIEDVTAYRTVRAAPPPATTREMIKTGGFDAVCFTSSSTVRNLVGIAGKAAHADHHRLHRPQNRRDSSRIRLAGGCPARYRCSRPAGRRMPNMRALPPRRVATPRKKSRRR